MQEKNALKEEMEMWKRKYKTLEEKIDDKLLQADEVLSEGAHIQEEKMKTIENKVDLKKKIESIVSDLSSMKKEAKGSRQAISELECKMSNWFLSLSEQMEERDQYFRKNSALVHGFKKLPPIYNTDFIYFIVDQLNYMFPSLNGSILPCHIDDAHPLNTKKKGGSKVVIIKFVNRWVKDKLLECRHDLYGSGFTITEHLTQNRLHLLSLAKSVVGNAHVTVYKTNIYAMCNGVEFKIAKIKDIDVLKDAVGRMNLSSTTNNNERSNIVQKSASPDSMNSTVTNHSQDTRPSPNGNINRGGYYSRGRPSYNGRGRNAFYPSQRRPYLVRDRNDYYQR